MILVAALVVMGGAAAVPIEGMRDFAPLHGRYAPGGDCTRQPQVVVDAAGIIFSGGPDLPAVTRPEYAATFMGNAYTGIALAFFPYPEEPRPYVLVFNADETPGRLTVEAYDMGYAGGPALPTRYRPWIAASPFTKCR